VRSICSAPACVSPSAARASARARLCVPVAGQQQQRPGQRQRGGFVPGDDEELHVVQELLRGHPPAGLRVLGLQHVVQEVVGAADGAVGGAAPPLVDGARDHGVHGPDRAAAEDRIRPRHPGGHMQEIQHRSAPDGLEIADDRGAVGRGVEMLAARQRHIADHVEGGRQHLGHHLRLVLRGGDPRRGTLGGGGHHRRQRGDVALCEDRSHRPALPAPFLALDREQTVADRGAQHPQHELRLRVVGGVVEKDPPERPGVLHHMPAAAEPAREHRLHIGQRRDDPEHVAPRRGKRLQQRKRPGGRLDSGGQGVHDTEVRRCGSRLKHRSAGLSCATSGAPGARPDGRRRWRPELPPQTPRHMPRSPAKAPRRARRLPRW